MLITEFLMTSSTPKPNTSPSPSLTGKSIPEVALMFLKSSPSLASSYFSSGSFSMDFREYFSSGSQVLYVGLTGLYILWAPWSPCSPHSGRIMDTNPGTASAGPALLSPEQKPSLRLVSSCYGCQFKLRMASASSL